ncbi:MAG: hypothetical protein U5L96_13150 [Owenweeksia sp.]|nr:hypothetical protein [Owenweeksia sp.]
MTAWSYSSTSLSSKPENKQGLIIFLHGAVSQFKFPQPKAIPASELLEQNADFLPAFNKEGYDIILPIAYNHYNWLEPAGWNFLAELTARYAHQYPKVFICGFSDGATGSYRYFYQHTGSFDGLILFNGYPQKQNFHQTVDYLSVRDKPVLFFATHKDKVIPYEFMLVEYRRQKMVNAQSYFTLREGTHAFAAYDSTDFGNCISYLQTKVEKREVNQDEILLYPPVDGLVVEGRVLEVYPFRKKIGRQYGIQKTEYSSLPSTKRFNKRLKQGGKLSLRPLAINRKDLDTKEEFSFEYRDGSQTNTLHLTNYLLIPAW